MNASVKKRLDKLAERMKPPIPWDDIGNFIAVQLRHLDQDLGFPEPPPELLPYKEHFLCGSTQEDWDELDRYRAAQYEKTFGPGSYQLNRDNRKKWRAELQAERNVNHEVDQ